MITPQHYMSACTCVYYNRHSFSFLKYVHSYVSFCLSKHIYIFLTASRRQFHLRQTFWSQRQDTRQDVTFYIFLFHIMQVGGAVLRTYMLDRRWTMDKHCKWKTCTNNPRFILSYSFFTQTITTQDKHNSLLGFSTSLVVISMLWYVHISLDHVKMAVKQVEIF